MRIGFYISEFSGSAGGGHSFESTLIANLMQRKSVHSFYFFSKKEMHQKKDFRKCVISKLFKKFNKARIYNVYDNQLNEVLLENKIELIWFLTPCAVQVQIPFISTVWDLAHRIYPFFPEVNYTGWTWDEREKYYRSTLPKAAYVITGTERGKQEIQKFYQVDENRIKILPFFVPSGIINAPAEPDIIIEKFNIKIPYLFYPAQFWPHKNHIVILLAQKVLSEKYNIKLDVVFTGSDKGNLDYIKQKVKEYGLINQVHFLGFVSLPEMQECYKNAFAMIFPTLFGPDNIPPLEAFYFKCPVIASAINGSAEQLGDAALLFNPCDEMLLVNCIKQLFEQPEIRKDLIQKGKIRVLHLTPEKYIDKMESIIDEFAAYRRCWSNEIPYVHL